MRIVHPQDTTILNPFTRGIKGPLLALAWLWLWTMIGPVASRAQETSAGTGDRESGVDPALERIWQLLSADLPTEIDDEVLAAAAEGAGNRRIEVDLGEQLLRLVIDDREAMVCPIASGHPAARTPKGSFTVATATENEELPHRGIFLGADGKTIMEDIDRGRDPMPAGASFRAQAVAVVIRLSGDGPTIQSGIATRTGTTSGDIRIPATAAETLLRFAGEGTPVTIR